MGEVKIKIKRLHLLLVCPLVLSLAVLAGCTASQPAPSLSTLAVTPTPSQGTPVLSPSAVSPIVSSSVPSPSSSVSSALPPAAEVIAMTSGFVSAATSYSLDRQINSEKKILNDPSGPSNYHVVSNMTLDLTGRNMSMSNIINLKAPEGQPAWPAMFNSIYISGDTIYMKGLFPEQPDLWSKAPVTENYWALQNEAVQLVNMLRLSSIQQISLETPGGKAGNTPCYLVRATPDLKSLWAIITAQPGVRIPTELPPGVGFNQIVNATEFKAWVSRDNGTLVQASLTFSFHIGPDQTASMTNEVTMTVSVDMVFHDYNQAVTITLPPEAKDATALDLQKY